MYKILLFDADDTLLDFKKSEKQALISTFTQFSINPTELLLSTFSETNSKLWKRLEKGEITRDYIIANRFKDTLFSLSIDYSPDLGIESVYQKKLAEQYFVTENAVEVCKKLSLTHEMYIITNGIYLTQKNRLEHSGLLPYFKGYFVSETVGYQKPNEKYFDYVLEHIGNSPKSDILIIGDSCSSDINGGILSGIDSCWYNPHNLPMTAIKEPTLEIKSLEELLSFL